MRVRRAECDVVDGGNPALVKDRGSDCGCG